MCTTLNNAVMFTLRNERNLSCIFSRSPGSRLSVSVAAGQVMPWSRSSKSTGTSSTWVRHQQKKPSEVSGAAHAHVSAANVIAVYELLLCCLLCGAVCWFTLCLSALKRGKLFHPGQIEPSLSSHPNHLRGMVDTDWVAKIPGLNI